jgi:hypothetical protein
MMSGTGSAAETARSPPQIAAARFMASAKGDVQWCVRKRQDHRLLIWRCIVDLTDLIDLSLDGH